MLLFKIILILIALYYLFYLGFRYVFPWLLKRYIRKTQEKFYGNRTQQSRNNKSKKEGEVNIDYMPDNGKKKKSSDLGEYVDYEEIED